MSVIAKTRTRGRTTVETTTGKLGYVKSKPSHAEQRRHWHKVASGSDSTACGEFVMRDWEATDRLPRRSELHCRTCFPRWGGEDHTNLALGELGFNLDTFIGGL